MQVAFRVVAALLLATLSLFGQTNGPNPDVERRVNEILGKMTLEQKIDYIGGYKDFYVRPMPDLGLPALKMADGPIGVRNYGPSTTFAGGIALAASWNPELARQVGTMIAHDARARGVHFMLGPGVNIYRAPMNARNFEYFGEDPFLAAQTAVGYIEGMQSQGVSATIKHYMGNNSEYLRHDSNSVIDERTMREIYLPTFETAVKVAKVGAMMDSYNLINGEHATQNGFINNQVVKQDWGFQGLIMSDWVATYDGVAAANGGLDLEMPSGAFMNRANLLPAIKSGKVSEETINDKLRRILRNAITMGWLDREQTDLGWSRYSEQSDKVALQSALEGMVLLKNDSGLLPLDRSKKVAVIGPLAYRGVPVGGGSAQVRPFETVSFLQGISNYVGSAGTILYHQGIPTLNDMAQQTEFTTAANGGKRGIAVQVFNTADMTGAPVQSYTALHVNMAIENPTRPLDEELAQQPMSTRWTGYYNSQTSGAYTVFAQANGEGSGYRVFVDDKKVLDDWNIAKALTDETTLQLTPGPHKVVLEQFRLNTHHTTRVRLGIVPLATVVDNEAIAIAKNADVVVLAVGFDPETESEGADRTFALPSGQDQLIQDIAAANKNVVVVVTSGGSVDMSGWVDKVPGLIQAWYPGQDGGTALAKIVYGEVNPSGHLPVTFERRWEDNPVHDSYYPEPGTKNVVYQEGVFVGYRGYEKNGVKPLFPFGYGLSYTAFKYANLQATPTSVSFDVTNTGERKGATVAQVYVGAPKSSVPRPAKELKGFAKVNLKPGEMQHVTLPLDDRSFSYYDVGSKSWKADKGNYDVMVGSSVEDVELRGSVTR
ncbi:MAG: beta-glucosidase H [Terriglobales bacterium]